ncbi:S-adenosyl-L-methionine-dependent methyltransferase [Endogone sp. FLAS-F59071]|nr:S-adenosyl-L-methionine-dependent methyltransferase [Endogone sp. FLAS-F59071]|eukprot:RUS17729.1 S-adenosyl-L-methionine-dependent methyltransferase [Endogone sp. FLAS-F59071]
MTISKPYGDAAYATSMANVHEKLSDTPSTEGTDAAFKLTSGRFSIKNGNLSLLLPIDVEESDRLNVQHLCYRQMLHGNFNAPVDDDLEEGIKVLDVGCGTGAWALDMAADYPNSEIHATNIVDGFPDTALSNVHFQVADALQGLPFSDNTFDFVFQRFMNTSFTPENWAKAVKEMIRVAKPGAYIELMEVDLMSKDRGPKYTIWNDAFTAVMQHRGIDIKSALKLSSYLEAAGAHKVETDRVSFPIGGWHDRRGELMKINCEMQITGMKAVMTQILQCSDEEYERIAEASSEEFTHYRTWGNSNNIREKQTWLHARELFQRFDGDEMMRAGGLRDQQYFVVGGGL